MDRYGVRNIERGKGEGKWLVKGHQAERVHCLRHNASKAGGSLLL